MSRRRAGWVRCHSKDAAGVSNFDWVSGWGSCAGSAEESQRGGGPSGSRLLLRGSE